MNMYSSASGGAMFVPDQIKRKAKKSSSLRTSKTLTYEALCAAEEIEIPEIIHAADEHAAQEHHEAA